MSQLHVVDGTYELFRAYFAVPSRTSPAGVEVGAVYGVCASMLAMLRADDVTHVGIATDHTVESFRNDLYDGYKTGEGIEEELYAQFPLLEDALRALGLVVWPMTEYEADDALATATKKYRRSFDRIVIASPDKDLAQCVEDGTVVQWDRRKDVWYDTAGVTAKFGVSPASIPDYLALVGDAADGIPGVPAWGVKSAATVLAAYGSLEKIPADFSTWRVKVRGAKRLGESLADHMEEAVLWKRLATLRRDVPLSEGKRDLEWRGAHRKTWKRFAEEHGLGGLAERPHRWR
ncbi:MAG: 5'-3' exonuclease [Planctomycetota bacterium]